MMFDWDEVKRLKTLQERGLDFCSCYEIFLTNHINLIDERKNYGELRYITIGKIKRRLIVIVWTKRN